MWKIKRFFKFFWQRRTRGWDDSETWNLDYTIAKFALPRLKRFKELNCGYPGDLTEEKWDLILDDMIYALDFYQDDDFCTSLDDRAKKGLKYFGEYFESLWS